MSRKSSICTGRVSGKPLTEYASQDEALRGADYAAANFGRKLVPYHCDRCAWWHLSPVDRKTPSTPCGACFGRDGRNKATYGSREDAERRAEILRAEQGVHLRAYQCDSGRGWHLTKNLQGW